MEKTERGNVKIKDGKEIKTGIRSFRGDSNVRRSNEGREAGGIQSTGR